MLKEFTYTDAKNKVSHRVVHPIAEPTDKMFAVDLTEFDADERAHYEAVLNEIHDQFIGAIKEAGLGHNFRFFKQDGIKS